MANTKTTIRFTPDKNAPPPELSTEALQVIGHAQPVGEVQFEVPHTALHAVIEQKQIAITHIYKTLDVIHRDMNQYLVKVSDSLPDRLDGVLLNPDGNPAQSVTIQIPAPVYSAEEIANNPQLKTLAWAVPHTVTDVRGAFQINLPAASLPINGLTLHIQGGNGNADVAINRVQLLEAHLGSLPLPKLLTPSATSIVAQLKGIQSDIMASSPKDVINNPADFAAPAPQLQLGEGDCGRFFRSNNGVIDRFRYSVLIRLIEPQMNQWQPLFRVRLGDQGYFPLRIPHKSDSFWTDTGAQNAIAQLQNLGELVLVNRVPVDRPIDVSEFHDAVEQHPVFLPKASTLGLGYIVHMQQMWIPAGLSLGDLVYSLPLAPGEQQRVAIEEKVQTLSERDTESYSASEFQTFRETQDSSALATFRSAFDEAARGGSHIDSNSHTASGSATASTGIIGAIFGGGGVTASYSDSSSSGNTSSWQNLSRDFASSAAQEMHSSLGRVAAASRSGTRTSIRMATSTERQQVTTRVVTNHNHNHALTMQWWEVLRHFAVTSEVDDVQLVCFVPFELVQFLPEGQPTTLITTPTRAQLLSRYRMVLRYYDVLYPFFTRNAEFAHGMRVLKQFAADPEAQPQSSKLNSDTVHVEVDGTFFAFEEVFVSMITRSGARLGPVKLTVQAGGANYSPTPEVYTTREELLGALKALRLRQNTPIIMTADIILPDWLPRSDIIRFDISRRFTSFSYKLKQIPFPFTIGSLLDAVNYNQLLNVSFTPDMLEAELGGPVIQNIKAKPLSGSDLITPASFNVGAQMSGLLPVPAQRIAAILSYNDLLRIETVFHHIVRNTVAYSKAVWSALTEEERAILLERYTIGVPQGGVTDATQEVPLLNCVANRVLGFFGNAAIMPFGIPPAVAASMKVTSRDIQDALLRFHRQAFQPTRSSITLPCRGTLGEAILGCCNAAEKIDLTRFWNWQDSAADQADAIPASVFSPATPLQFTAAASGAGGSGVGGGAGSAGSIISINSGQPGISGTDIVGKLIEKAPDLQSALNLTGLDALQKQISADTTSASEGRKEAIDSVTQIQTQAMKSAESIVKSVADAAGKAASTTATGGASAAAGAAGGGG